MKNRITDYLRAQIEESKGRNMPDSLFHAGFRHGLGLAIRTIETDEVSIWSTGSDEFYRDKYDEQE